MEKTWMHTFKNISKNERLKTFQTGTIFSLCPYWASWKQFSSSKSLSEVRWQQFIYIVVPYDPGKYEWMNVHIKCKHFYHYAIWNKIQTLKV